MTNVEAEQEIARHLESGERLLWSGAPRKGIILRASDALLIPFSILWCAFAIFWEVMVLRSAPVFFAVWGIPFVAMGLYIVLGRFAVDSMSRAKTAYALTDRRILIISGLRSRSVKSLPLETLSEITLEERSSGSGTITFGPPNPLTRYIGPGVWPWARGYQGAAFELIDNVGDVHRRIREAQRALNQHGR